MQESGQDISLVDNFGIGQVTDFSLGQVTKNRSAAKTRYRHPPGAPVAQRFTFSEPRAHTPIVLRVD